MLKLGETKTFSPEYEKLSVVDKSLYCAAALLNVSVHDNSYDLLLPGVLLHDMHVFVFICETSGLIEEAAHINPPVRFSRVNAVDRATGLTWESIVLISLVSLSI